MRVELSIKCFRQNIVPNRNQIVFLENIMTALPQIYVEVTKNKSVNLIRVYFRQVFIKIFHKICLT